MGHWKGQLCAAVILVGFGTGARGAGPQQFVPPAPAVAGNALFPVGPLYPYYLADPHESGISFEIIGVADADIPQAGDSRIGLRLGGQIGLIRGDSDLGLWQITVEAGFDGQFDNDRGQDNLGWEGNYGLALDLQPSPALAGKVFVLHTSSHLGDEYIEQTGRRRLEYTREELGVALSWAPAVRWRAYGELGWGYDLRNDVLQDPWRVQGGLEYEDPRALAGGRLGWFAAVDLAAWQERDWDADVAAKVGWVVPAPDRTVRIGLQYVNGRPTLGEFFQHDEAYFSIGLWLYL